jgi:serine/threonine-protein kinase
MGDLVSEAQVPTTLVPGFRLDRYELLAPIAEGGFGHVWLARLRGKRGFEKLVAIKVPRLSADTHFEQMLLDEARIASAIDHPNVCKIIELGEQADVLYIVMEWIDGEPLSTLLRQIDRQGVTLPVPLSLRIVGEMCLAAHAAHELCGPDGAPLGVVHRDISPQNALITGSGSVKLIDFGIAKARDRATGDTTEGTLKGKIRYMSPEQAFGRGVDRRADIFALGAVLFRLLAGKAPFDAENEVAILHKLATRAELLPLPASVPSAVRDVVGRALKLDPNERFQTAQAMYEAMAALGMIAEASDVAAFTENHLRDRIAKRRAAVDIALKAAAERRVNDTGRYAAAPLSSSKEVGMENSGVSASVSMAAASVGATRNTTSIDLAPAVPPISPHKASGLRWLWAIALAIGAIGIAMISVVVGARRAHSTSASAAPASSAAVDAPVALPIAIDLAPPPTATALPSASPSVSASASAKPVVRASPPPAHPAKPKPAGPASTAVDFGY